MSIKVNIPKLDHNKELSRINKFLSHYFLVIGSPGGYKGFSLLSVLKGDVRVFQDPSKNRTFHEALRGIKEAYRKIELNEEPAYNRNKIAVIVTRITKYSFDTKIHSFVMHKSLFDKFTGKNWKR
jgi:hypothetical protein